jgi:predicted O-linked N-acetylglucosamine transferase (SPINDLY family)
LLERAKALHSAARLSEAEAAYRDLLDLEPSNFDANHNLGILALQTGRTELAIDRLRQAVASNRHHVHANANLGTAHLLANRLEEALQAYDRTLDLDPRLAGGWRNRGTILERLGRHEDAAESFQRCWQLAPEFDFALGSMFEARRYACDWRDYQQNVSLILAGMAAGRNVDRPFSFLSVSGSAEQQLLCAKLHAAYLNPRPPHPAWRGARYDHSKIRLAYVSADYRSHVMMHLMAPIFEGHDAGRFHTIGVSLGADDGSPIVERAKRSLSQFIDVSGLPDREAAQAIRNLEADIAVDLTGYTAGGRAAIFAHRPAPVQVGYLGFAGTSGASYFDYLIADRVAIPPDHERFFSEQIVRLPQYFPALDDADPCAGRAPRRQDLGLPDAAFVFCAFNNAYKLNPVIFDVWMSLLREIPHGVLWLRDGNIGMRQNLQREAAARGVDPGRLVFAPQLPAHKDHLARQWQADLFLDTLPFGAHSTARDALWAGLPVLTCLGGSFASRVAGSLLSALDLPSLMTENLHDYAARALELARDPAQLASLRSRLVQNLRDPSRFGTKRYLAHLESAYQTMWERARCGAAPTSFDVPEGGTRAVSIVE